MNLFSHKDVRGQDLAWLLERKIMERTGVRVRQLQVETKASRVNVRGTSLSYHVKHLAILAIFETVPQCDSLSFALDIDVRERVGYHPGRDHLQRKEWRNFFVFFGFSF